MATKYIIDNLAEQTISGSLSAITLSADTLYVSGNSVSKPYKVYTALLTQTGTSAPEAIVLENTLGLNPTYNYENPGFYYLEDLAGLFLPNKTAVFMQFKNGGPTFEIYVDNVNKVYIVTAGQDDVLLNTFIEIRVYN